MWAIRPVQRKKKFLCSLDCLYSSHTQFAQLRPSMKGTFENPRDDVADQTNKELKGVLKIGEWYFKHHRGKKVVRRWAGSKGYSKASFLKTKADWAGRCVRASRQYDRSKGLECTLTEQDVQHLWNVNNCCHYCGDLMVLEDRLRNTNGMTLERLDNSQGHTLENCVLACKDCNVSLHISAIIEKIKRNKHLGEFLLKTILYSTHA